MKRRPLPVAATLAATAALLLTGCSRDDNTTANDKIAEVDTADKKSSSPSPYGSEAKGRPQIEVPSDLMITFERSETGDSVKDAVLRDNAERMRAVDAAITGTDPNGEAIAYYNTGKALEASLSWVAQFEEANSTITGDVRYYDRQVTLKGKGSTYLTFCADESKGFRKDKKTDKIYKTPVTKNSYVLYNTRLDENSDGVWQTSQIISTRGAAQCQP